MREAMGSTKVPVLPFSAGSLEAPEYAPLGAPGLASGFGVAGGRGTGLGVHLPFSSTKSPMQAVQAPLPLAHLAHCSSGHFLHRPAAVA